MRIIIELLKNSADSYTRLQKKEKVTPPFEIFIKIFGMKKTPPSIEILDHASGMDSKKLKEALKYGTQTSMGEDTNAVTSAEKGIGLKDALMALKDNWLITIKNGLVNERNKHPDFKTGIGKENEKVTKETRGKWEIPQNGTLVQGKLPAYFSERKFSTICDKLQQHFLLRKLLQNSDFKVYAKGEREQILLKYTPPKKIKQVLKETFKIKFDGKTYTILLEINKSKDELKHGKPYGQAGLLFFYGKYSVLDFTFCRYDKELTFSKFFGEVQMEIQKLIKDPNIAPIVDEKRRGLDSEHPFNSKLIEEINKRLKSIQEKEETSKYLFDERSKTAVLRELNKIYKEIKGRGGPVDPPIKPDTFAFYPVYSSIFEFDPKKIYLIINSSFVSRELEIVLNSTNSDIVIKGDSLLKFDKEELEEEFIIKQKDVYSEKPNIRGEIIASTKSPTHSEKMGIEVLENPIFSPSDGFAFVPEQTTIIDSGEKKVRLCIDKNVIGNSKEITLTSQEPINCPGKWLLPDLDNIRDRIIKNIFIVEVPIKVRGKNHIGEKAIVTAKYGDKTTDLHITVVPEPSFTGLFRDIRPSAKETKKIIRFIEEEGVLELYYKHPLIKKYMIQKNFRNKGEFLVFITDTITREAIRGIVVSGIKENLSTFPIWDIDHPELAIEEHTTRLYYEQGPKMHGLFVGLAKSLKIEG